MRSEPQRALTIILAAIAVSIILNLTAGCTAIPAVAGYFMSGGVTLYKSAKESGPKAEFVALKVVLPPPCIPCKLQDAPPKDSHVQGK